MAITSWLHRGLLTLALLGACGVVWAGDVVVGKLGQTTQSTPIYAGPSRGSRVLYRCEPFEYVVLRKSPVTGWCRILLESGKDGYMLADAVAQLPYEITAKENAPSKGPGPIAGTNSRASVARYGLNFVGTPYKWGGTDLQSGIDCSAFVKKLYGAIGVNLPRTAAEQVNVGQPILRLEDLKPGDRLYFWEAKRNKVGHTGIYLGNGYFVHSSRGKRGVDTDFLTEKWLTILVAARR